MANDNREKVQVKEHSPLEGRSAARRTLKPPFRSCFLRPATDTNLLPKQVFDNSLTSVCLRHASNVPTEISGIYKLGVVGNLLHALLRSGATTVIGSSYYWFIRDQWTHENKKSINIGQTITLIENCVHNVGPN
mgnify:CR=1 FL=1